MADQASATYQAQDRNLALDLVRVTEAAALAAHRWMGRGNKIEADGAATEAMRRAFDTVEIDGIVVIGEGEMDEAPMLFIGEKVGARRPEAWTSRSTRWRAPHSRPKAARTRMTVIAHGRAPAIFCMPRIATWTRSPSAAGCRPAWCNLGAPRSKENMLAQWLAKAKKCDVSDLVLCTLDRDRHGEIIGQDARAGRAASC